MAKRNFSRRAEILKRALDCIDSGHYSDFGRFMVFGNVGVSWTGEKEDPGEVHLHLEDSVSETEESKAWREINGCLSQLQTDSTRHDARQYVKERTSLDKPLPLTRESYLELWRKASDHLSPKAKAVLREWLEEEASQEKPEVVEDQQEASATVDPSELADLDYSQEILGKLENVRRAVAS